MGWATEYLERIKTANGFTEAVDPYLVPAFMGIAPGAVSGALAAGPDHRLRGALAGGAAGALGGAAGSHVGSEAEARMLPDYDGRAWGTYTGHGLGSVAAGLAAGRLAR